MPVNIEDLDFSVTPWVKVIETSQATPKEFSWRVVQTTLFFEVVNANPQKRQNVVLHHLDVEEVVSMWSRGA